MNFFTRLIREMNFTYESDNTPFLTREETEQMTVMFHGLMMFIINDCHFQGNINTRYCINKIMDYLEMKPEIRIKHSFKKRQ